MAFWNPTFILGVLVLIYLSSFILLALLRITTGISIQRFGYFSLRHIAYTPKDGIKVEIRGLGLFLHRPTFAQPTWLSLVIQEPKIIVDLQLLGNERDGDSRPKENGLAEGADGPNCALGPEVASTPMLDFTPRQLRRSRTWDRICHVKNWVKRLHRSIGWLRMLDVVASNTIFVINDVGSVEVGNFTVAVDTRRKTVDRARLFHHGKSKAPAHYPAEWILTIKSVLFTPEGKESLEILDQCSLNIHGLLYKELEGLRDAAISLKLGRVHIPYDDFILSSKRIQNCRRAYGKRRIAFDESKSLPYTLGEGTGSVHREEDIVQTVSDSKEFISSVLRGIQEVQFAVSFLGLTKQIHSIQPSGSPLYLNFAMKEVGVDMHRLDPKSPAHRMYFSSKDVSHQALLAAIGLSIDVDDSRVAPERLVYVPMLTTTIKTTLPSKTVEFSADKGADERNANILFANVVTTSPSMDLDPKHLPILLALLRGQPKPARASNHGNHNLLSRLLPKASIKLSIQEPVIRVSLPAMEKDRLDPDDYDLLISSVSSISLELESSHSSTGALHYALASALRVNSSHLYYQTASGARHNLLMTENLELKVQVSAIPEVLVSATANLQTFSVHLVRPEISEGIRQIIRQMRSDVKPTRAQMSTAAHRPNFLRAMPAWLRSFRLQGTDFSVEVAGVDPDISPTTRGIAFQLESWTADYKAQRDDTASNRQSKRRATNRGSNADRTFLEVSSPSPSRHAQRDSTDGRRLALHVHGLEGFVVESNETWEAEPFIALPRLEVAFSTSTDVQGQVFHIHTYMKTIYLQYSLYRHYSMGVATMVLKNAFGRANSLPSDDQKLDVATEEDSLTSLSPEGLPVGQELITIDVKATFVQVKAFMPADPPLMLRVYGLDCGRHRWAAPFFKSKLVRLYADSPKMTRAWSRLVSLKAARVDLRENRRKTSKGISVERSIDVTADAIRLAVPHQLVVHKVFDNIVNVVKATEQLHHRFKTGTNEYILEKQPEGPKNIPRTSIRSRVMLLEFEDSAFEWKLASIYRAGLIEQKHRLAREEAFKLKMQKMEESRKSQSSSRVRARSSNNDRRSDGDTITGQDDSKADADRETHEARGRYMRYSPEQGCGLSDRATISAKEAWNKLQVHNAQSWRKRIDWVLDFQKNAMHSMRSLFWGDDQPPEDIDSPEIILGLPQRPSLMSTQINDLHIIIDKPSFARKDYAKFVHQMGKGMPYDTKYSLLIPMHVQIDMGEARINLRDYPLPLLQIPPMRPNQSSRLPSWSLKTDFVIAEEYRDAESSRHVKVVVVPPDSSDSRKGEFAIDVRRTVSPVKTYSDVKIDINTTDPTRFTWGTSYQPAIQDMMMIVETFTKPQADPSERVGFWDKIRLSVHSRVNVCWKSDGDVHLILKGSRDPYVVTGYGAGFVMCWRNDVRWQICRDEDPRKFMTVNSGEYVLAVPDFSHQARQSIDAAAGHDTDSISTSSSTKNSALFKKVIMKLSGNVQWMAGLVFERNIAGGGRSFDFKPHYEITMKNPNFAKAPAGEVYDAFNGFRSHHIHMSVAVAAPVDREWNPQNLQPSTSYNTVHLTPRFFTHFFSWWSMFSGAMALPIRQGKLWPGVEKSSKKFGRHLATLKYSLFISPLFISHVYKHKDAEDYADNIVSATGLKIRLDSFMLDLHQRREEFASQVKGRKGQTKTSGMRINQAQLDFISADIRAVSASIAGTTADDLKRANDETLASYQQPVTSIDMSRFTIPDNDFSWIDMDDFVELDWILPAESNPKTKIMPLAYAPRFTYFRQTDHDDTICGDPNRSSPFGNEPTHYCALSPDLDPRTIQCEIIKKRLRTLEEQIDHHDRSLGESELLVVRDDYKDEQLKEQHAMLRHHGGILRKKKRFLQAMLKRYSQGLQPQDSDSLQDDDTEERSTRSARSTKSAASADIGPEPDLEAVDSLPIADFASDFNNRFMIHNVQLKWHNSLRNIILRYIHQVSQRRGFVYYMSRPAVKFILDIVEEQNRSKQSGQDQKADGESPRQAPTPHFEEEDSELSVEDRIQQLLGDAKKFVNADDPMYSQASRNATNENLAGHIAPEYTAQNSYHVRLIAPQIQLQSEKNPKSAVLVTAKDMQLKVVQIMDKERVTDEVSGLVQRRFSLDMDSVQFFTTSQRSFATKYLHLYSGVRYGTPAGQAWPPWVPFEVMFDFQTNPFGFSRVVQKTSASLKYDKYNTLRLKFNDDITNEEAGQNLGATDNENRVDQLWVDFPQVRAICDSFQYYAMYVIVIDLLLYNEPLEKVRSERLEKIMLASDFSDLRGAPEMVNTLQERIRSLEEIKMHFQVNAKYLDRQGWEDRLAIEQDLTSCEDELFFMMKAITTSQRKYDDRTQNNGLLTWNLSASEVVWHLTRDGGEALMEFQLKNAAYERTDNTDGSNENFMQIERIHGLNLLPNALYPEMIAPFRDNTKAAADGAMLQIKWYMLEAIAGIPVMDHFEVNVVPLKVQLEREVGVKLFEYVFPGAGSSGQDKAVLSSLTSKKPRISQEGLSEEEDRTSGAETNGGSVQETDITGTETLETRLIPTLTLAKHHGSKSPTHLKPKRVDSSGPQEDGHHFRFFQSQNKPKLTSRPTALRATSNKPSTDSLRMTPIRKNDRSTTSLSGLHSSAMSEKSSSRFTLAGKDKHGQEKNGKPSDDLTQMISRASNYMTLAYVKIPSVVLCLSYKGRGERNIEDVHDFVFRMPVLEYRNKTWSNLDLALQLKRDVIKALISHTGAIIGNKLSHHRPSKPHQSRLREVANYSSLLPTMSSTTNTSSTLVADNMSTTSGSGSQRNSSPGAGRSVSPPRKSFASSTNERMTFASSRRNGSTASFVSSTAPASLYDSSETASRGRPMTADASITTTTASTKDDGTNGDSADSHSFMMKNKLARRLTSLSHKGWNSRDSGLAREEDEGDSTRRKSRMLLGKKILGSLN